MFSNKVSNKVSQLMAVLLAAAILVVGLAVPLAWADGEAPAGTVQGVRTYTYYPPTALTAVATQATTYSGVPRIETGVDISHVRSWNSLDMFVTLDVSGTGTITVTPQFSPDQSDWTDGDYRHITFSGDATTTISTLNTQTYQLALSSDSTDYINAIPIAGEYLRFKILYAGSGTVTPTIKGTLRNN